MIRSGAGSGDPKGRYCANLGHKQDDESGLIYMRSRYYEPGSGRFMREDPSMAGGNWYSYCDNNPAGRKDTTGKDWKDDAYFALGKFFWALGLWLAKGGLAAYISGMKEVAEGEALFYSTAGLMGEPQILAGKAQCATGATLLMEGAICMWIGNLFNALGSDADEFMQSIVEMVDQFKDLALPG